MRADCLKWKRDERAVFELRQLFEGYGYAPYKMSKFEEYDLYVRNKSFLVSDHIITFTDRGGRLLALKPDVTLSIVKNAKDGKAGVQKVYYDENVYRTAEGSGEFREIMQVGLECIGCIDTYAICEVLSLASQSLASLSSDFVLEVSHLDFLARVLGYVGVDAAAQARLLHCIAEKNAHDIESICRAERVGEHFITLLKRLINTYGKPEDVMPVLREMAQGDDRMKQALDELDSVIGSLGTLSEHLRIDFSLVSDMSYYNGIVFRGYIKGIPTRILSGGQYDGLMSRMGKRARAIGFALYLDLLEDLGEGPAEYDADTVVLYDDATAPAQLLALVSECAGQGKRTLALRQLPEKLRYCELQDVRGGDKRG